MTQSKKNLRTCINGHQYYKSSDCPVCPVCAKEDKPNDDFLSKLGAPARRALTNAGIDSIEKLSACSKKEILKLHGMGPASLPILSEILRENGLGFKE